MLEVESILKGKYSVNALESFKVFKKEATSLETGDVQVCELKKVDVRWISAITGHPEDYIKAIVLSVPGWLIRDGFAVKTDQFGLEM